MSAAVAIAAALVAIAGGVVAVLAARDARRAAAFAYDEIESYYVNRDVASGRAIPVACAALIDVSTAGDRSEVYRCNADNAPPCPHRDEPWRIVGELCGLGDDVHGA